MPYRSGRLDKGLAALQRQGMRKGVLGSSRPWLYVFVAAFGLRKVRQTIGSEYEVVWRGEVRPGETIRIGHLAETYDGQARPVPSPQDQAVTHACGTDRPGTRQWAGHASPPPQPPP